MDIASLIVLCITLAIAFTFKLNSGVVSIAMALIFSWIADVPGSFLVKSFNSSLFLTLLGVMYLFSIAQENKTLDLLAKKIFNLCKGAPKLLPVVIFFTGAFISAIGPGIISATALMAVLMVALADEMDLPVIRLAPFGLLGAFAGGISPITPSGIVAINVAGESGITGVGMDVAIKMFITCLLYAVILYFFIFKWHRVKTLSLKANEGAAEAIPGFSAKQIATLVGIFAVAAISTIFSINVGLISFVVAVVLLLIKAADEGAVMKKIPWGTLVMVTGVGILISLVTELGGIDLLSEGLKKLMSTKTATAIMALLSGVMSWVSSASGVVMPTLIPTTPGLAAEMGINAVSLVNSISIGANVAALSPLSTCGGLMLAAYSSSPKADAESRNQLFGRLFLMSACGVVFSALLGLIGLY